VRYRIDHSSALALLLLLSPAAARAQSVSRADSSRIVEEAQKRQRDFERFRQSRIPVDRERSGGSCDQLIGRICIWFGGEDEERFPDERPEVGVARRELIGVLARAAEQIGDSWVTGQLVRYLVENGSLRDAERVARGCEIDETWWCSALAGYVRHVGGDFLGAEAAFRDALANMPEDERERWTSPRYLFTRDQERDFERLEPAERGHAWELFWRLSDPLFLVEGNDRLTDHFARRVEAKNEEHAESPQGLEWDEDLEETLIRYGRIVGWSRTHDPASTMGRRGGFSLQDTRRVLGHHHPRSRGYLFPPDFLQSPSDIPPESWITAPREARSWYAPPYAPDFNALESQVGRFRRDDEMLVVGAYRPAPSATAVSGAPEDGIAAEVTGPVESALFLVPEATEDDVVETHGDRAAGVFTLRAPPGRYVSSLEVLDAEGKRAWRARQGVQQVPMVPGLVAVSDLLILREGASLPATLDEAIPDVRPGVRIGQGERFTVVWEVYGLRVQEPTRVTLGFTQGRPGFLARVGDFLGLLEPDRPVEVTFSDPGDDSVQSAFRAVVLELPELDPGEYTLHLRVDLQGRESVVASRPIVVVG
jgi:hypothetical protein